MNRYAEQFIRQHANNEKPFCLYVAHEAIHNPVQVPGDPVRRTPEKWDRWRWQAHSPEERIEKFKGMTMPLDQGVGEIRKTLVDLGIERDTFVLFFSDNGPAGDWPDSDDFRGRKGSIYEGGHKVPAIAWWPGKIRPNTSSNEPLISIDVMPTLLDLAGVDCDVNLDGVSFHWCSMKLPYRNASVLGIDVKWWPAERSRATKSVEAGCTTSESHPGSYENLCTELYHLAKDPGETNNLAQQHPEKVESMRTQLQTWLAETNATATKQPGGW